MALESSRNKMNGFAEQNRAINTFILTLMELAGVGTRTVQKVLDNYKAEIENATVLDAEFTLTLNIAVINKALSYNPRDKWEHNVERAKGIWEVSEEKADRIIDRANCNNANILNPYMAKYPYRLLINKKYPPVLYCRGDLTLLNEDKSVAIIGTREPTEFGKRMGQRLAEILSEDGYVIVSGLAIGCDTAAHTGALDAAGKTIAVLPTPIDAPVYPKQNQALADRILENDGLLVSEYPPGIQLRKNQLISNLVARDEWQPGLSDGVIAIETSVDSGTNHAIRHAIGTETPIAVFDYSSRKTVDFYGDGRFGGNVKYLREGAYPIFEPSTVEDFKCAMQAYREKHAKTTNDGEAISIFNNQRFSEDL